MATAKRIALILPAGDDERRRYTRHRMTKRARATTSRPTRAPGPEPRDPRKEGWHGWDDYADFYDWENARTLGRRDVPFWLRMTSAVEGRVLELGCGTGRVTMPLAHEGVQIVGVDRSAEMLARARRRMRRQRRGPAPVLVRADIRALPLPDASLPMVMAPYGILQSLVNDRDIRATLKDVARVTAPDGIFALELVADLPAWGEYSRKVRMRGQRTPGGSRITLIESVRQDRDRGVTMFDQEFVETRGRTTRRRAFTLTFRTLTVPAMLRRLTAAGFRTEALLGDYDGGPLGLDAEAWIIVARRVL
jgi:SAM-dependent methyltransferase